MKALIVVFALVFIGGCSPTAPTPPQIPTSNITCTASNGGTIENCGSGNGNVTNPTPSPSAGVNGGLCSEMHAFISSFGWNGPPSATRPNNQTQPYPLCKDCESLLTATLKTPSGDAPLSVSSGKGRPEWTVDVPGTVSITTDPSQTNNVDGYNLMVRPVGAVGSTATVNLKFNASCIGDPVKGEFKYVIIGS